MTKLLRIATGISLPLETLTETIAIVAKRRVGKSYLARRIAEEIFRAGQQMVIIDPKGDHWGIKSAADGKSPGLPIIILGGEHADVPLESTGGEVVARLVVEKRVSVLVDLSLFRKHEVATFMTAYLENVYRLKAREEYRTPMMQIIDEADAIAPQRPQKGEERMLGAADDIVRRGGQRGIGSTLITQRTAVLNKNVLTQAQILIALRTIAPQDLKALWAWVEVHGTAEQGAALMESLPSLPRGDAWFWSPGWPTEDGIFERAHVLPIETYDSGATPKPGQKRAEPQRVAEVDIDAFREEMAETIQRAKENDPRELRKQIAELKRQVSIKPAPTAERSPRIKDGAERAARAEVAAVLRERDDTIRVLTNRINRVVKLLARANEPLTALATELGAPLPVLRNERSSLASPDNVSAPQPRRTERALVSANSNGGVSRSQQKLLDTLSMLESVGITQPSKTQLAVWAEVSPTSGGYFNNLGALRSGGFIEYPQAAAVSLTDHGRDHANVSEPPSAEEMQQALFAKVGASKAAILRELIRIYQKAAEKAALAERIGVSPTSGGYFNNLGSLRTLGVIDYPQAGYVAAQPVLFLE